MCEVISIEEHKKLGWFKKTLGYRVFFYEETLELFDFVEDAGRFADGSNFVCKNCGHTAGYVRMDCAELHKAFIVVHVICGNCGTIWKKDGIKPLYETFFEDWDTDLDPEWK